MFFALYFRFKCCCIFLSSLVAKIRHKSLNYWNESTQHFSEPKPRIRADYSWLARSLFTCLFDKSSFFLNSPDTRYFFHRFYLFFPNGFMHVFTHGSITNPPVTIYTWEIPFECYSPFSLNSVLKATHPPCNDKKKVLNEMKERKKKKKSDAKNVRIVCLSVGVFVCYQKRLWKYNAFACVCVCYWKPKW